MTKKISDIYLFLARRDKTGIRVLAKFKGQNQLPSRISDIKSLNLPIDWTTNITKIIAESKMLWEPWIQSANSYNELIDALKVRGFSNIPMNSRLEYNPANLQVPIVNSSNLPNKKTMLRKS